MKTLRIEPSDFTPKVYFCAEEQLFEISGFSRPADVISFYTPIIEWINNYSEKLIEIKKEKIEFSRNIRFAFRLTYFNSTSAKSLLHILDRIKELKSHNIPIEVEWYYDEGDDQILEDGEDLASATNMKFKYIEIKS